MKSIIDIARECGASTYRQLGADGQSIEFQEAALTVFADRIRAEERERCAKEAERHVTHPDDPTNEVWQCAYNHVANEIAAAIRTPGEKAE